MPGPISTSRLERATVLPYRLVSPRAEMTAVTRPSSERSYEEALGGNLADGALDTVHRHRHRARRAVNRADVDGGAGDEALGVEPVE